ncbi:hypothetical protein [Clostridium manihotivorum]|nr:hypothetical protein [Clostridium manihotivorum]
MDSNTVYGKGMQGYTALTIIEENLNKLDELLKEASNEINKHDELNRMYYQSLESDIKYLRDYKNKYQSFIGGTYNVNGDGGFVGEYKDTVDDPYYKQKEALLDKLSDLKLEDIKVKNTLGVTTNMRMFYNNTYDKPSKVSIKDILGFGNISDNIRKQYEESKDLIEKYNEGLDTYNEADYPSLLPGFAKKIWYKLTKKKEKTIDNYDDYLDSIIESGDFNFATENEQKLTIGLDLIPVIGEVKMSLEAMSGEEFISKRKLNGLETLLSIVPIGIRGVSGAKNGIKVGEIVGKVEGSVSFGMNSGGQLQDIINRLRNSKAEEDMVAKGAVEIDKRNTQAEIRERVLKNIEESKTAREASNYKEFAEFENGFKVGGKTKYDNIDINNLKESNPVELDNIINDIRQNGGSPLDIPENATINAKSMNKGYQQIKYNWSDGTYKYESRWHTETPGAVKYDRGTTWVVTRTIPGNAQGQMRVTEYLVGDNWINEDIWNAAERANMAGKATQEQMDLLEAGHWLAK